MRKVSLEAKTLLYWNINLIYNGKEGCIAGITTERALQLLTDVECHTGPKRYLRRRVGLLLDEIINDNFCPKPSSPRVI